jgi:hypothetical protein
VTCGSTSLRYWGDDPSQWTQGRLTYQLRRLRLHGLIERVPGSTRYTVTERGIKVALWFSRCHARLFRPALGELLAEGYAEDGPLLAAYVFPSPAAAGRRN